MESPMPRSGSRDDENMQDILEGCVSHGAGGAVGSEADAHWCWLSPLWSLDPDVDMHPGLLSPAVGEHAEQSILAPRRPPVAASVEVRHGHAVCQGSRFGRASQGDSMRRPLPPGIREAHAGGSLLRDD